MKKIVIVLLLICICNVVNANSTGQDWKKIIDDEFVEVYLKKDSVTHFEEYGDKFTHGSYGVYDKQTKTMSIVTVIVQDKTLQYYETKRCDKQNETTKCRVYPYDLPLKLINPTADMFEYIVISYMVNKG